MPSLNSMGEIEYLVGQPELSVNDDCGQHPSAPSVPQHELCPQSDRIVAAFHHEQLLFLGDSWQSQANAKLNKLLVETSKKNTKQGRGRIRKRLETPSQTVLARFESVDTRASSLFRKDDKDHWPTTLNKRFADVLGRYSNSASIAIMGLDGLQVTSTPESPHHTRLLVNETLWGLYESTPPSIKIIWRSFSWCQSCEWSIPSTDEESINTNYLVYTANQQARITIQELQRVKQAKIYYMDWAREMLHYSFHEDRSKREVGDESSMLLLQKLANKLNCIKTAPAVHAKRFHARQMNKTLPRPRVSRVLSQQEEMGDIAVAYTRGILNTTANATTILDSVFPGDPATTNDIMTQISFNFLTLHFIETVIVMLFFLLRKWKRQGLPPP